MNRREAVFRADLGKAVKGNFGNSGYVQNNFDPAIKGLPDTEFIIHGGQSHVELKCVDSLPGSDSGLAFDWGVQPTPIQLNAIYAVQMAGGQGRCAVLFEPLSVVVVRSAGWIRALRGGKVNILNAAQGDLPRSARLTVGELKSLVANGSQGVFRWNGVRTAAETLVSMLVGPVP